jgi:putative Holliday junction resolvase
VLENVGHKNFGDYSVDGIAARLILESWMSEHPRSGDKV